jgi:SPP1 gp7 family putative phage head morphogenesis protein
VRSFTFDAKPRTLHGKFKPSTQAEREFARSLQKIARAAAGIVDSHIDGVEIKNPMEMQRQLEQYSARLEPWARRQSAKLLSTVSNSNLQAYEKKIKTVVKDAARKQSNASKALIRELQSGETGLMAMTLMTEQVNLIKSIPIEAGLRAQEIAYKAAVEGRRIQPDASLIDQLQEELGMTEEVAVNRARLIARTETARANASINQARAMKVGSNQYRWHNSGDSAVRHSHKVYKGKPLQGRIFSWDSPPTLDDGMTGHPGTFPNCRCFAEPVFGGE